MLLIPDGLGNSARPDVPGRQLQRRQSIQQSADDRTRPEALLKRHDLAAERGVSQCLRPVITHVLTMSALQPPTPSTSRGPAELFR